MKREIQNKIKESGLKQVFIAAKMENILQRHFTAHMITDIIAGRRFIQPDELNAFNSIVEPSIRIHNIKGE